MNSHRRRDLRGRIRHPGSHVDHSPGCLTARSEREIDRVQAGPVVGIDEVQDRGRNLDKNLAISDGRQGNLFDHENLGTSQFANHCYPHEYLHP